MLSGRAKPVILVCGGPAFDRQFMDSAWVVNKTYTTAVTTAGGIPLLPADSGSAGDYAEFGDGLILTGFNSFSPEPTPQRYRRIKAEEIPKRNAFDAALYQAFKGAGKPVLGICLGHQVINEQEGGTTVEHCKHEEGIEHIWLQHPVEISCASVLHQLFGAHLIINSRHNNQIGVLAPSLRATAFSPDGVIEAIEHLYLPVYGVQWHPERMRGDIPDPPEGVDMSPLFAWFIRRCTSVP
ncbi:MAG: gamma-glutamyl-gamma-aminobutyrate hydrolase family protein [Treponema sp.]|jgi:putative glutamine amidotransferase|nr:gamma-glutamyl-gamma-aminobutyrate hydrolase family protein [Treponema sp.]